MKTLSTKKIAIIITTVLFFISGIYCKEEPIEIPEETPVKELSGIITFKIGNAFINDIAAALGDKVKQDDIIKTEKKSAIVIQFSDSALVTLHSNTTMQVAELTQIKDRKPLIELFQTSGSTFNKIVKNKANYRVKTPTSVASVRGTSFSVMVQKNNKSNVKLLHGEVNVADPESTQLITLVNNQKIEATAKGFSNVKGLDKYEQKRLEKLDQIEILPEETLKETGTEPEIMPEATEKIITDEDDKEPGYTIPYLRKKYGKLSEIQTKDGRTFIGAFKQIGDKMEIISTKGKLVLPVSKIKKVSPY